MLFELFERVQRLEAPRAGRLIDETGLSYAPSCACGGRDRIFVPIELEEAPGQVLERWICADCDALWVFSEGEIAVREIQVPSRAGLENELGEIEQLAQALQLLDHWESRLYLQLYLWEDRRDRAEIARIANKRWRSSRWSEWKVRQAIAGAQKKIHRALRLKARARLNPTMTLDDHRKGRGKR